MTNSFIPVLVLLAACGSVVAAARGDSSIDESAARKLAIAQYNQLFRDKFILNPADSQYKRFPELDATYFHEAKIKDGCWQLTGFPPAGWYVVAKVSLDGEWVQLTSAGYAAE